MAKLTTTDLANLTNETSAITTINANNALIETAMENTLSRDGTATNTLSADIDLNSYDLLNVGQIDATTITLDGISILSSLPSVTPRGAWVTLTVYAIGDLVNNSNITYICNTAHTAAASFSTDLASKYWTVFATAPSLVKTPERFSGNGSNVAFTLGSTAASEDFLSVYISGVYQNHDQFSLSGTTLTFSSAPAAGTNNIEVSYSVVNTGTDATASAASAAAALVSENAAAADVVLTNADVVLTNADVVLTNADVVSTNADVVTTSAHVTSLTGFASTTSLAIGTGSKVFTVAAGLSLVAGDWVLASSDAAPTVDYMHGPIASYSGTTLTVTVDNIGGSGTKTDWTIRRSGTQGATGATGATGAAGSGSGDMLAAQNLSDVDSASTSRTNLGVAIGSNVQAFGAVLDDFNTLGAATTDGEFVVATGAGAFAYESGATARTSLGLGTFAVEAVNAVPAITLAGAVTGADQTISAVNLKDFGITTYAADGSGSIAWSLSNGNHQKATISAASAFTFTNWVASDEYQALLLSLTNGSAYTITWTGVDTWLTNSRAAPSTLQNSGYDAVVVWTYDGGTTVYGAHVA
jgi:hypothetical protein